VEVLPDAGAFSLPFQGLLLYDRERTLTGLRAAPVLGRAMEDASKALSIQVAVGPEGDAEDIAEATLQLRQELLDLDVAVEVPRAGEPPPGARAVGLPAIDALLVTLGQSQLLAAVVAAVQSWLSRSRQRSIKLQLGGDILELTGLPSAEQRRLTDEWLRRHKGS
jgi:Effector Associated Constant Component 1